MSKTTTISKERQIPVFVEPAGIRLLIVGDNTAKIRELHSQMKERSVGYVRVVTPNPQEDLKIYCRTQSCMSLLQKEFDDSDLSGINMVIADTGDSILDGKIRKAANSKNILVYSEGSHNGALPKGYYREDFSLPGKINGKNSFGEEKKWKRIATLLVIAFGLMILGHIIISNLPLASFGEITDYVGSYITYEFLLFVLAGFLAQMVDGLLSMGYGVTSATCLMSFGINPVSISAAIHTSEIFTSGVSGYSHYKFGSVNKKIFKHLVIPGVIGAIIGAALLVFIGDNAGKWLMPFLAVYAMFLGFRILMKAFQTKIVAKKIKRIGWLAWTGGFFDSIGGGGWGPIVTSTLIAKGRSPKYTIGSVSLTEFFITLASAITFFITIGIGHWNIVLGLLIGGAIAAPFAARLAGKLPRKTMMIAVGIMVIIWCTRMLIKSFA